MCGRSDGLDYAFQEHEEQRLSECDEVHINMSWVPKKGCQCKINNSPSFKVSRCLQEEEDRRRGGVLVPKFQNFFRARLVSPKKR